MVFKYISLLKLQNKITKDRLQKSTNRFATIRSAQVIHRQINQHQEENRHRDQLQGYKKMRREHQKHLISYENKLKGEMDEYRLVVFLKFSYVNLV